MPVVTATSFADPADVAAFDAAKARGLSDKEAFKFGDNGIGAWGDNTADPTVCMCALPHEVLIAKWGTLAAAHNKPVVVTYNGTTSAGVVGDTMPHLANIYNGAGIDLNPGFLKAFGLTPPQKLANVDWAWA